MAMDGHDISIHSTNEMEEYESLRQWEFGHTHVYDVNLLERVGMDKELVDISYAAPQAHEIIKIALHREYPLWTRYLYHV
jgi:hypothetical protein